MSKVKINVGISIEARTYAKLLKLNCSRLLESAIMVYAGNQEDKRDVEELQKANNWIEQEIERLAVEKAANQDKLSIRKLEIEKQQKEKEDVAIKRYHWMRENILHRVGGRH